MTSIGSQGDVGAGRRTALERALDQVRGVDALVAWAAASLAEISAAPGSREGHLDGARQRAAVLRARQAMRDQLAQEAAAAGTGLTAVLAHRSDWFIRTAAAALMPAGITVIAQVSNGADAVGICTAEQPDVILVEDQLPTLPGMQVMRLLRAFSPRTQVVAQVAYPDRVGSMLDAGAAHAFARQVPPVDVAAALVRLLTEPAR